MLAISNARQIHMALVEFEHEYGKFPDADTAALVRFKTATSLRLGKKFSNDYFRQLLASGNGNEKIYYARIRNARQSDDRFDSVNALEKGECAFSYIPGANSASPADRPVAVTPLIPGTMRFDPKPFDKKAIVLYCDGSARTLTINRHEDVMIAGKNIFDPSNPCWGGVPPVIVWPE